MLRVVHAEFRTKVLYAECRYAEGHVARLQRHDIQQTDTQENDILQNDTEDNCDTHPNSHNMYYFDRDNVLYRMSF